MLWGAWLVGALFDRRTVLGWAGLWFCLAGLSLIGVGIGRELRGLAALRRVDQLREEFASGEADGFSGRHGVGWKGCPGTGGCCRLWPRLTLRKLSCAVALRAGPGVAGRDGCSGADRRSSERRDHRGDAFACAGRSGCWLARRPANSAGGGPARNAAGNFGDSGFATENGDGGGDGRSYRNRRERGDTRYCFSPAVAAPGG